MFKKVNTIAIAIILLLCSFQTIVVQATVRNYSVNSSYKTWNGNKVGATTLGVWYDDAAQGTGMPRIELGVSGSRGNHWYDYQCKTKATFCVWHEPGTKGPIIDSTLVYTTSITQTKNITIKIIVT